MKVENKMRFSTRLKQIRTQRGFSQNQLAKVAGLTSSAISQFEGNLREPTLTSLKKLSKTLKVSIDYLVDIDNTIDFNIPPTLSEKIKMYGNELISLSKEINYRDNLQSENESV